MHNTLQDAEVDTGFETVEQAPEQASEQPVGEQAVADVAEQPPEQEQPAAYVNIPDPEPLKVLTVEQAVELQKANQAPTLHLDDGSKIVQLDGGGVRLERAPIKLDAPPAAVMSERGMSRREAEILAGQRAVARHKDVVARMPRAKPTEAELKATGHNVPVVRPGNFREYLNLRAGNTSKDAGGAAANLLAPADPKTE